MDEPAKTDAKTIRERYQFKWKTSKGSNKKFKYVGFEPLTQQEQRSVDDNFWFIHNESDAYIFMLAVQDLPNSKGKEVIGVASVNQDTGARGILILPWSGNDLKNSNSNPYSRLHGNYYEDWNGTRYTVLSYVHTHVTLGADDNPISKDTFEGDLQTTRNLPHVPMYVITTNMYIQYPTFSFPGNTSDLLNGNVSLIPK
jgi:hypothetical protein